MVVISLHDVRTIDSFHRLNFSECIFDHLVVIVFFHKLLDGHGFYRDVLLKILSVALINPAELSNSDRRSMGIPPELLHLLHGPI
jgi:hypothetical protein